MNLSCICNILQWYKHIFGIWNGEYKQLFCLFSNIFKPGVCFCLVHNSPDASTMIISLCFLFSAGSKPPKWLLCIFYYLWQITLTTYLACSYAVWLLTEHVIDIKYFCTTCHHHKVVCVNDRSPNFKMKFWMNLLYIKFCTYTPWQPEAVSLLYCHAYLNLYWFFFYCPA